MDCLRKLWSLLQEVSDLSIENNDLFLDYETLSALRTQLQQTMDADGGSDATTDIGNTTKLTAKESAQVLAVLAPSRVLRLKRDPHGRISTRALFTYAHLFSRTRAAEVALRRLSATTPSSTSSSSSESAVPGSNTMRQNENPESSALVLAPAHLHRFIIEKAATIPVLQPLTTSMKSFAKPYARIATQRFCFYECRADKRSLNVSSVVGSPVLSEFLDLQQVHDDTDPNSRALGMHYWFSLPNIRKIYNCFLVRSMKYSPPPHITRFTLRARAAESALRSGDSCIRSHSARIISWLTGFSFPFRVRCCWREPSLSQIFFPALSTNQALDSRKMGSLTVSDFLSFPSNASNHQSASAPGFTQAFASRVFEVMANRQQRASGRRKPVAAQGPGSATMALEEFADFWLAWEDKRSRPALQYFMRIFDIEGNGHYLSRASLKHFLLDIRQGYRELTVTSIEDLSSFEDHEPFNVDDVIDEVFDMLNSENQKHITLKDLEVSRVSQTAISILSDAHGFIAYDQREQNMHQNDLDEDDHPLL